MRLAVEESPLQIAPPFRTLHLRYPVEDLAESLAERIMTAHRAMPEFQLDSGQIADPDEYLKSLEVHLVACIGTGLTNCT